MDGDRCRIASCLLRVFVFPASLPVRCLILLPLLAALSLPVTAGTVVQFNFDDGAGGFLNAPAFTAPQLTAGEWSDSDKSLGFAGGNPGQAVTATKFDNGNTLGFTLSVADGFQLSLDGYGFDQRASATGPTAWSLLIAKTPAAGGTTVVNNFANASGTLDVAGLRGDVAIDLYADGAGTSQGTWRIDNFQLQGEVTPLAAPLPASLVLLASALLWLPRWHRHRSIIRR